jgi:LEA14-like dessication related protein
MGRWLLLVLVAVGLVGSCARPLPPTVKPESLQVTRITPAGIDVIARMTVTNSNAVGLSVRSVRATMRLGNGTVLGPIVVAHAVSLPARRPTVVEVPLSLPWANVLALAQLVAAQSDVGYELEGTAAVGNETLNVDVPFTIKGVLRSADIVRMTLGM